MELKFAFLARAADVLKDGSFAAIGAGLGDFSSTSFPVAANMALVVNVELSPKDREKQHTIRVQFHDHSDTRLPGYDSEIRVPKLEAPVGLEGSNSSFTCIFQMPGVLFQAPGKHRFRIHGEEGPLADIEIRAIQAPMETKKG